MRQGTRELQTRVSLTRSTDNSIRVTRIHCTET